MEIEYIWHGRRYWVQEPMPNQHIGWNTRFEPCFVLRKTAKRIYIRSPSFGNMQLNRLAFERDGKVYHSRVHEYFYAYLPKVDPERPGQKFHDMMAELNGSTPALSVLGLKPGCSKDDIRRAYKRLARKAHPDTGGTHETFLNLQRAMETAMRGL